MFKNPRCGVLVVKYKSRLLNMVSMVRMNHMVFNQTATCSDYWPGVAIRGNLTYHITVHFRAFLEKPRFCYRNGHHKQYILVDTIFNYRFHFGLPGKCLYLSPQNTPFWRRRSRRQKGVFSGLV